MALIESRWKYFILQRQFGRTCQRFFQSGETLYSVIAQSLNRAQAAFQRLIENTGSHQIFIRASTLLI
jgi:hypothetical protein